MEITTQVDVEVFVDMDEVIKKASAGEKEYLRASLDMNTPSQEQALWDELRLVVHTQRLDQVLKLVETIAWQHHNTFVDTSALQRRICA